jgi:hypothetical protein
MVVIIALQAARKRTAIEVAISTSFDLGKDIA